MDCSCGAAGWALQDPLPTPCGPGPSAHGLSAEHLQALPPSGSHMKGNKGMKTTLGEVNLSTSCVTSEETAAREVKGPSKDTHQASVQSSELK